MTALIGVLACGLATVAHGDDITVDGDAVETAQVDPVSFNLASGGSTTKNARFTLVCKTKNHVDAGETVTLTFDAGASTIPAGGSLSATNGSIIRPSTWPADEANCASPAQTVSSGSAGTGNDSTVSLTAPTAAGTHTFKAVWEIGGAGVDTNDVSGSKVTATYTVTVAAGDTTAPTVSSINLAGASPTSSGSVGWTVTFSESVSGVDAADFALAPTGVSGASISTVSPAGPASVYTVTANTGTGSGTLGLNLVDDDSITDAAGNKLGGTGTGNGNFTGQVYTVDKTPPTFSCTPAAPDSNWHANDQSFSCTSADTGGAGPATPATFTLSTNVAAGTHDSNASTNSVTVSDGVGNSTTAQFTGIKVDKRGPVTTFSQSPAANGAGWNKANVDVTLSATDDGGSGVAAIRYTLDGSEPTASHGTVYSGVFTISAEGETSLKFRAIDEVGNAEATQTQTIKIDKTAPTFSCTPAAPDSNWHPDNQSFACTAADTGGSGVASPSPATFTLSTNVADDTHDSDASTNSQEITDVAGNTAAAQFDHIKVDRRDPATTFSQSPAANGAGWNKANVDVTLSATDNGGSGVDAIRYTLDGLEPTASHGTVYSGVFTISSEGETSLKFRAIDEVGNAEATQTQTIKIDKTAPTFSCDPAAPDSNWHANDQSFDCDAADTGGSGVASPLGSFTLSTNVATGTHDPNASTNSQLITDVAGNSTTAQFTGIKVDKRDPVSSFSQSPAANGAGWNKTDVDVTLSAADNGGSGVDKIVYTLDGSTPTSLHGTVYGGVFTISSEGERMLKFRAIDNVGNAEATQSRTIKIDRTNPTFSCTPAGPDSDWHATDQSFSCNAADTGGSGVSTPTGAFTLSTNVADGTHNSNASTNSQSITDVAGNSTTAQFTGIKVDKRKPTFGACTGGPFILNTGSHAVSITASDNGGSGIDGAGSTLSGSVSTGTVGAKTVTFTAKDNVGNTDTKTCTYQVNYNFIGFLSPLNSNPEVANVGNAGRTYPVKWQLTDGASPPNYITDAASTTTVRVDKIACSALDGDPLDAIDYAVSTSASGLRYDATANQYIYNWGTPSTKNTCYRLTITTPDTVAHVALFQMR